MSGGGLRSRSGGRGRSSFSGRRNAAAPGPSRAGRGISSVARSPREGTAPVAPRIAVAGVLGAVLIGILVLRLWALTVLNGAEYAERADQNQIRRLPVVAQRGSILDRHGRKIVVNREVRQVVLDLQDVDPERLDQLAVDLGRVLAPNELEVPATTERIREKIANAPRGAVEPVVLDRDVDRDEVIWYLEEHRAEFPGIDTRTTFERKYDRNQTAAHILGQVGAVTQDDLDSNPSLQPIDRIGKSGLEGRYDKFLRGTDGYDAVQVDAAGVRTDAPGGVRGLPATPGRDLVTTIDLRLQEATRRAVVDGIEGARKAADGSGRSANAAAAVAIDPKTGDVLSLVSFPDYDPNVFVRPGKKNEDMAAWLVSPNNKRQPMFNRAIAGTYAPGSTYKPITAFAAMDKGWITPSSRINCPPSMEIYHQVFRNHSKTAFGEIDLPTALEMSCDTYFYDLAIRFYNDPKSPLQSWSKKFGLGRTTGLDLPGEAAGLVPTPEWKKNVESETWTEADHDWRPGDSVNLSIGQGDLLVTPLQMTNVYAALANGGTLHTPRLAKSVQSVGGREQVEFPVGESHDLDLDPSELASVVEGLRRVNTGANGTATAVFESFDVPTAGKSGTAEKFGQPDLAWYCGFAPVEDPTIAACAFIDKGGHGGSAAGPVVLKMFQQWFGKKGGNAAVHGTTVD